MSNDDVIYERLMYRAYAEVYHTNTLDEWVHYKNGVLDTLYALNSENVLLQEPYWSNQLNNLWQEKERDTLDRNTTG